MKDVDNGMREKDITEKIGIPASTVSTSIKNRESVLQRQEPVGANSERSNIYRG